MVGFNVLVSGLVLRDDGYVSGGLSVYSLLSLLACRCLAIPGHFVSQTFSSHSSLWSNLTLQRFLGSLSFDDFAWDIFIISTSLLHQHLVILSSPCKPWKSFFVIFILYLVLCPTSHISLSLALIKIFVSWLSWTGKVSTTDAWSSCCLPKTRSLWSKNQESLVKSYMYVPFTSTSREIVQST